MVSGPFCCSYPQTLLLLDPSRPAVTPDKKISESEVKGASARCCVCVVAGAGAGVRPTFRRKRSSDRVARRRRSYAGLGGCESVGERPVSLHAVDSFTERGVALSQSRQQAEFSVGDGCQRGVAHQQSVAVACHCPEVDYMMRREMHTYK